MIHETKPEERRCLLAAQMETARCRDRFKREHRLTLTKNHFSILALPPLAVAITVNLIQLAVGIYGERAPEAAPAPLPRVEFSDRQFLASLNAQRPVVVDVTEADQGFLSALVAEEMAHVPRATFVAPPRMKSPEAKYETSMMLAGAAEGESVIPRATFVAPPRSTLVMSTDRVASGMPRRSSIFIYEAKVVTAKR